MGISKVYTTTASIKPETKAKLRLLKIHPRQPEDEVIAQLVDQELAKRNLGKVLNIPGREPSAKQMSPYLSLAVLSELPSRVVQLSDTSFSNFYELSENIVDF